MEPEIRYTTTADGVSIAYYAMGEGHALVVPPVILWGHLRFQSFREYYRSRSGTGLGRGLQVVRYDARGTGLSDRYSLDFSIDARLRDLEAVVERLKLTRFAIFGHTHGATAAITYATAHPERVSHLVLSDVYARGRDWRETARPFDSLRYANDHEHWERYTLTMANSYLDFSDGESARKLAALFRESMTPESLRAFFSAQEAIDLTELLPQVAVPTLVIYGPTPFSAAPLEWSREVASKIPEARFVTFQHSFRWTDDETRIVEEFLGVEPEATPTSARSGAAPLLAKPSAIHTILFTDIVGHTEMMQRLGDTRGREVLRDHERITRETLKQYGGAEVKTDGDSFMATFASVSAAVECAVALQRALAQYSETAGQPIVARMGLNVGEPIEEDGDFFGSAVILGARIKDQAAGGEILVPEAVRHLLSGKSFAFGERGEFALKGFEEPVRLYEVRWREDG